MAGQPGFFDGDEKHKGCRSISAAALREFPELYESHFEIIRADTPALLDRVYRVRYQVYCVESLFEDPAQNPSGCEVDDEDKRAAHVLLVHRKSGHD